MDQRIELLIGVKEENLPETLKYHSSRNGFDVHTYTATSGEQLRQKLNDHQYNAVISDYYLGDENVIKILREENIEIPFMIHTWYHNQLLEDKALKNGASAMTQKKEHIRYFNELLYMVFNFSDLRDLQKKEREDLKLIIDRNGDVLQMNSSSEGLIQEGDEVSRISEHIKRKQVKETVQETLELGASTLETVFENDGGLVNYKLHFTELENRKGISVTGMPTEELRYIEKDVYPKLSEASGKKISD